MSPRDGHHRVALLNTRQSARHIGPARRDRLGHPPECSHPIRRRREPPVPGPGQSAADRCQGGRRVWRRTDDPAPRFLPPSRSSPQRSPLGDDSRVRSANAKKRVRPARDHHALARGRWIPGAGWLKTRRTDFPEGGVLEARQADEEAPLLSGVGLASSQALGGSIGRSFCRASARPFSCPMGVIEWCC